jgi:hypothetical protein
LGRLGKLPQLRWLTINDWNVSLAASMGLAHSSTLQQLNLYRCSVAPGALTQLGHCNSLRTLSLRECEVVEADVNDLRGQRSDLSVTVSESRDGEGA